MAAVAAEVKKRMNKYTWTEWGTGYGPPGYFYDVIEREAGPREYRDKQRS